MRAHTVVLLRAAIGWDTLEQAGRTLNSPA